MRSAKFLGLCVLILAVAACGKVAEKAAEKAIEMAAEGEGGEVDVDISEDGISVKGTDKDGNAVNFDADEKGMNITSGDGTVNLSSDGTVTGVDEDGKAFKMTGDSDSMTITTDDGVTNVSLDGNVEVPESFPKDVPVYTNMSIQMAQEDAEDMTMISGTSKDSMDVIAKYYKEQAVAQGWTEKTDMNQATGVRMLEYAKDDRTLNIFLMSDGQDTSIQVAVE